jgi:hypothetical protein
MPTPQPIIEERVAIILGVCMLAAGAAAFFSCRAAVSLFRRLGWQNPLGSKTYLAYYRFHSYYWWAFGVILITHVFMGVVHTGLPQAGDPDAWIHWLILGAGLGTALASGLQFGTCRVCLAYFTRRKIIEAARAPLVFRYHSSYWAVFFLLALLHFAAGFYHAGLWPAGE